ncbi:MAG TPA: CO dehydrogenase/acetyl-CoA synthase subunit delta [Halobacteria archaeon]|nr:CO dehydrogenase/acetyl-CoA synthase subunit delta [Halobacteria archaeon]
MDKMTQLLKLLENTDTIELNEFRMDFEELELNIMPAIQQVVQTAQRQAQQAEIVREAILAEEFKPPIYNYPGEVAEVQLGAGTRKPVFLGGQKALYRFEEPQPNPPVVTFDVFDIPMPGLPRPIREHFEDVMEHPGDWAKKAVKDFGANMVTIHLIGTGPKVMDKTPQQAAAAIEEVLQAVDVPIVIGGSGNPEKDPEVLEKAAEVAEGERCLIASANKDMDWERIGNAAKKYGHNILSWTQLDMNNQRELNRKLLKVVEMPRDRIVMDPTTAALGYGLDYAYTNMERIRLAALGGDDELNFPMSSGTTNAWGAREAWMKESPMPEDSEWGTRDFRGPLWEIYTGLPLALAGVNLFMMMHPLSVRVLKETTQALLGMIEGEKVDISNWIKEV